MPALDAPALQLEKRTLGLVVLAATAATLVVLAVTGFRARPAPLLAAAFVGGAAIFLLLEFLRSGVASPAALFVLGLAYYHILIPVEYLIDPELPRSLLNEYPQMTEAHLVLPLQASCLALVAFCIGYALRRRAHAPVAERPLNERRLTVAAAALTAVGVALYLAMSYVGTGSLVGVFHTTYQERDELFYGLGALGFGINLVYVGCTCLAVQWIARGGSVRTLLAILLCAMMGVHSFLVGSKMHVFHVGLGTLVGARAASPRTGRMATIALLFVLAIPLLFVGLARNKQGQGASAMAEFVVEEADADSVNPANIDAWGPYLTLLHTTATLRIPRDLRWGASYLQCITLLPPRFLYPNRPQPLEDDFAKDFLGKDYYDNAGFGFSGVAEGYVNLGLMGVVVVFFGAGLGFGAVRDALSRRKGALGAALLVATAAPWAALALREQAASIAKGYGLMTLLPTAAILWFAKPRAPSRA